MNIMIILLLLLFITTILFYLLQKKEYDDFNIVNSSQNYIQKMIFRKLSISDKSVKSKKFWLNCLHIGISVNITIYVMEIILDYFSMYSNITINVFFWNCNYNSVLNITSIYN